MDILDRDMFDPRANTPKETSWTMAVMSTLDGVLGPGVMEKPMFDTRTGSSPASVPEAAVLKNLRSGEFDELFHSEKPLSEMTREASQQLPTPSVVVSVPFRVAPIRAEPPKYPPIARAAHVEGLVAVNFTVTPQGKTENLSFDGDKLIMLHGAVQDAVAGWQFPESAESYMEHTTIAFNLNCQTSAKPH